MDKSNVTQLHPRDKKDSNEDLLLTANDEYKMKVWNPSAKSSRKTCLGPTYGGEIKQMKILKVES